MSGSSPIVVAPARAEDASAVRAILEEVRSWLAERGIEQWARPFAEGWVDDRIAAGEFWVARRDGEPVAVVRLLWTDPLFWGDRDKNDAVYVHSLAVRRDLAGSGIGREVLAWVEGQAAARGRPFLRLDCLAANTRLRAYYEHLGFSVVGPARLGGEVMVLLEKRLVGRAHAATR